MVLYSYGPNSLVHLVLKDLKVRLDPAAIDSGRSTTARPEDAAV